MAKQLVFEDEARQPLAEGVGKLARAVISTLGPRGRSAVLDKGWGSPKVTKDGVTVAEDIDLEDPYENLAAQLVKEAASKTNDVAGDGTTTATVLAQAIYREGSKSVAAGANPMDLKRGIDTAVEIELAPNRKTASHTQQQQILRFAHYRFGVVPGNAWQFEQVQSYRFPLGVALRPEHESCFSRCCG